VTGAPAASGAATALASTARGHRELDGADKLVGAGQDRAGGQQKRDDAGGHRLTADGTQCLPH
jgi:hypothetical protein